MRRYSPADRGGRHGRGASRLHDEKLEMSSPILLCGGQKDLREAVKEEGLVEIEKDYRTQSVQHCHIETPISLPIWKREESSSPHPHSPILCRVISQALGPPWARIRVIKPYIGGGFNKQDVLMSP